MKLNKNYSVFPGLLLLATVLFQKEVVAQESEGPLWYNAQQIIETEKLRNQDPASQRGGGGTQTLPFFDDFSRYSLPTNDPAIPQSWQRWSDRSAHINCTFPIAPPTIGVATLDAIGANGRPYGVDSLIMYSPSVVEVDLPWGSADTLTSLPIDLSPYEPDDNVYLLFHYQPGGLGNRPDVVNFFENDSLVVEFFSPFGQGEWFYKWSAFPTNNTSEFQSVFIKIEEPEYLRNGFRFRFRNYASYGGSIDHWHIDYVLLSQIPNIDNFQYDEVGFQYCENTLLTRDYTSMPWTHFLSNPQEYMADNFTFRQRNLGQTKNIATRTVIRHEGNLEFQSSDDLNTSGNGFSSFSRTVSLQNYAYNVAAELEEAEFQVCTYYNPTDANTMNDTMCFVQRLSNYYAYDDGSAESTYQTEGSGMSVAMKFTAEMPDTVIGFLLSISPAFYNTSANSFFARIWANQGGVPGAELTENFTFHKPKYYWNSEDFFVYYPLDEPTYVSGQFFIGWIQQSEARYYFGLDKNTSANGSKLFYRTSFFAPWTQSSVSGSLMIRPVFRAGMPDWVSVDEEHVAHSFNLYPNPANDILNIQMQSDNEWYNARVYDVAGKLLTTERWRNTGNHVLNITELPLGYYTIALSDERGSFSSSKHFVKQ